MASHPEWGLRTTATEVAEAFSGEIRGKNVVVTGVSPESLGAATALAIASQGPAKLILASRTASKLDEVVADIKQKHPSVSVLPVLLDLGSVDSVKTAAATILASLEAGGDDGRLDILINNAGISGSARDAIVAPNGTKLDQQLFVNHLGPFLLTSLLLPALQKAAASASQQTQQSNTTIPTRIVNLTSHGHRLSPIRFSDYAFEKSLFDESLPASERANKNSPPFLQRLMEDGFPGFVAYGQSKCANVLYATELSRRYGLGSSGAASAPLLAFSVHPGSIETGLLYKLDPQGQQDLLRTAPADQWKSPDAGAATTLVAAFDPALGAFDVRAGEGGGVGYLADCQLREDLVAPHAKDAAAARRLWEESEKMLGIVAGPRL